VQSKIGSDKTGFGRVGNFCSPLVEIERLVLRIYLKVDIYKSINNFDAYLQLYRFVYLTSDLCLSVSRIHPKGAIICIYSEASDCLLHFFTQFHAIPHGRQSRPLKNDQTVMI
jgi:hypothetical protein